MKDKLYLARLKGDLSRWESGGQIAKGAAETLLADAAARAGDHAPPIRTLSLLAAAAMGFALLTFIAANWSALSDAI